MMNILSLFFLLCGALLALSAAIGLVRFRDTMSRLHAVTKPQTLGLICTITGTILHVLSSEQLGPGERGDMGVLFLIILFALLTAPVVAQRVGRLARKEGLYEESFLSRDDTEGKKIARKHK